MGMGSSQVKKKMMDRPVTELTVFPVNKNGTLSALLQ
jgi:hypothetical protein